MCVVISDMEQNSVIIQFYLKLTKAETCIRILVYLNDEGSVERTHEATS